MNNFWTRALTGSIFVALLIFFSIFSKFLLALLFLAFTIVGTAEYFKMIGTDEDKSVNKFAGFFLSICLYVLTVLVCLFNYPGLYLTILIPIAVTIFILELFRLKPDGFSNILHTLLPSIYIAAPFALFICSNELIQLSNQAYSAQLTLVFFFTLWANDTGAYLDGRSLGKQKLFPKVSPNKTWEGTIGGAVVAVGVAYFCSTFFENLSKVEWVIMAVIIVVFGSLGDLVESMLKRSYGVKDSGRILPGHGGILDRFDGLLIASPVVFTFIVFIRLL
jgi:phosphatidate cytidylyltransferase